MLTNKKTCELAVHFNCIEHEMSEISYFVNFDNSGENWSNMIRYKKLGANHRFTSYRSVSWGPLLLLFFLPQTGSKKQTKPTATDFACGLV